MKKERKKKERKYIDGKSPGKIPSFGGNGGGVGGFGGANDHLGNGDGHGHEPVVPGYISPNRGCCCDCSVRDLLGEVN